MGEDKAEALAKVANGEDVPAARIEADRIIWLADGPAASRL